jgi:hypothetical protein
MSIGLGPEFNHGAGSLNARSGPGDLPTMPNPSRNDPDGGEHLPTMPDPTNDPERGIQLPSDPDPDTGSKPQTRIDDPPRDRGEEEKRQA